MADRVEVTPLVQEALKAMANDLQSPGLNKLGQALMAVARELDRVSKEVDDAANMDDGTF